MSDDPAECPLCMEALEIDDHSFFPCTCGYQICRFCWHRIRTDENGLCPACRKQYPEDPAEFKPLTDDELHNIKKERKQKDVQRKQKAAENRKHLANVRVVQKNLLFVVGLSPRLADAEVLKKHEYFGKFGKFHKVVINQSTSYAGSQGPSASAYVTYVKPEDALKAILTVNNIHVDGRTLKTSLGTTKYCSHFLKGSHCQKNDCMYLHELGEEAASFTKEEMQAGKHQEYEQMLIDQFLNAQNAASNNHLGNNKIKKPVSPQVTESSEMIPSLLEMQSDTKNIHYNPGPLLPNPVQGGATSQVHSNNSNSNWLDGAICPASGNGSKFEHSAAGSSSRTQPPNNKPQHRTNTPPISGNSRVVGTGSQRSSSSTSSTDESHIPNAINTPSSSRTPSSTPPGDRDRSSNSPQNDLSSHRSLLLPNLVTSLSQLPPLSLRTGSGTSVSACTVPDTTTLVHSGGAHVQPQQHQEQQTDHSSINGIGAIGSNRRPGLSEVDSAEGLSFFDLPNGSLANHEMADSLPVSSCTDWSAAFGFRNKELLPDDDLGFDPCAESFKGLADLIEKENGMQQHHQYYHTAQQQQKRLESPPDTNFLPHSLHHSPIQNSNPLLRSVPPGFSISHLQLQHQQQQLQQQQQQNFFRQELNSSKLLDLLPQYTTTSHQRYPPLSSYHSLPQDLHVHQQHQQLQRDFYSMKDMQEQLRSMLPNINISFGTFPLQQHAQQQLQHAQQQQQQQQAPTSLHQTQQHQQFSKNWPLSSSPDSSLWNDPAIVSTSQFTDSAGIFQDNTPHWLKSLQQLTESDSASHRLPFVQQFPLATVGGWPPHTYNPPPGFRAGGLPSQQTTDTHKMAEVLQ